MNVDIVKKPKRRKRPLGRPTIMTQDKIDKLVEAFKYGASDVEACAYADIATTTLYKYQEKNPDFADYKAKLKELPIFTARKSVVDRLPKDPELALKFLERRKRDEFSLRTEHTGKNGGPIELKPVEVMDVGGPEHA